MSDTAVIDGKLFADLIKSGAANLAANVKKVNDLNVFPIPDGDTGDNMLLTVESGIKVKLDDCDSLSDVSGRIAQGMLLGARGNSGVILSQFFEGFASEFAGVVTADVDTIKKALRAGVQYAYNAVIEPTEGTILTVMREATEYAYLQDCHTPDELLGCFIEEANRALEKTPELLDVLKKAGVVDSGGAGLIYIAEGIRKAYNGESVNASESKTELDKSEVNYDLFDENSIMKYGYCTEVLLRLQRSKTDPDSFRIELITDFLKTIGNSVVAFKAGTAVKIHVHTMTPDKVLAFCQQYGEFLTVKVENMTLQHSGTEIPEDKMPTERTHQRYGVVAVASGDGIKQAFYEMGADEIIDGGQCMNPSTDEFIKAFDRVNADTVIVLPNNGNVILTANQAAKLYTKSEVRILESKTIGDGYAALSMLNTDSGDTDAIMSELAETIHNVVTVEFSQTVRDSSLDGLEIHKGDYIGFCGKHILSCADDRIKAVCQAMPGLDLRSHEVCILIRGADSTEEEASQIRNTVLSENPGTEVYMINGGQNIYSYILIAE